VKSSGSTASNWEQSVQQLALKTSTALSGKIKDNLIAKLSSNIEFQDEVADVGVSPFFVEVHF
jgi:hypothetical protein